MGMEVIGAVEKQGEMEMKPIMLLVGPPSVGKRSLINGLGATRHSLAAHDLSWYKWTIDTKYYTADVRVGVGRLHDIKLENSPQIQSLYGRCEALVMVFDLSNPSSFEELQQWVSGVDLEAFEILLCVGSKADRVPEHFAHAEYRRRLQKRGESSSDPHPEFWDFGIQPSEGRNLLSENVDSLEDRRRSGSEWCSEKGIEYIEACTINELFDQCIVSVDGDTQGVARIRGALSAHMWPGLHMKDQSLVGDTPSGRDGEELSSDSDSDFYIEYELLSNGSDGPIGWEDLGNFSNPLEPIINEQEESNETHTQTSISESNDPHLVAGVPDVVLALGIDMSEEARRNQLELGSTNLSGSGEGRLRDSGRRRQHREQGFEDAEKLMREMACMRENMHSMSDQNRREMAAQLAMRMANMFNDDEDSD